MLAFQVSLQLSSRIARARAHARFESSLCPRNSGLVFSLRRRRAFATAVSQYVFQASDGSEEASEGDALKVGDIVQFTNWGDEDRSIGVIVSLSSSSVDIRPFSSNKKEKIVWARKDQISKVVMRTEIDDPDILWEAQRYETRLEPVDEKKREEYLKEYSQLRNTLLRDSVITNCIGTLLCCTIVLSQGDSNVLAPQICLSFFGGGLLGTLYLYLLSRKVDNLVEAKLDVIPLPLILALPFALLLYKGAFMFVVPAGLGFLGHKIALLARLAKDSPKQK
eukprot:CAMPEP_0184656406 /NCGR_PEP_ID=MMETSP0308-20130426/16484_1 /TAXON_ID=38269 /ORGANISM="Gloeochaete witrockiana, Strain SAG 46.84" /LENGTH=278 /DNA_ID=CAMNT_0027093525 /DNA_START=29 /DNA_END=865 /DNA_ORIENTATION=+